jgi:hypothetical protein
MPITPPHPWPGPPAPINWNAMTIDEVNEKIASLDSRTAGYDNEIESGKKEIEKIRKKLAINKKAGLGGVVGFAAGMALHMAFTCPPLMIIAVAANALSIGAMIFQHRYDGKEMDARENIRELEHQKNLAGIYRTAAAEQLEKKMVAKETKEKAARKDFQDLAKGVESEPGEAGAVEDQEQWINIDGVRLAKKGEIAS